jgi:hypothetical protein
MNAPRILETRTKPPRGFRFGTVETSPGQTRRWIIRNRDCRSCLCPETPAANECLPERQLCRALHAACEAP